MEEDAGGCNLSGQEVRLAIFREKVSINILKLTCRHQRGLTQITAQADLYVKVHATVL